MASSTLLAKFKDFPLAPSFKASYQGPLSIDHTLQAIVAAEPTHGFLPLSDGQDLLNMIDGEVAQQAGFESFLPPPHQELLLPRSLMLTSSPSREFGGPPFSFCLHPNSSDWHQE